MKQAVRNIQTILNKNGYDAGSADGVMGAKTKVAIAAFQKDNGMDATGEVDEKLVQQAAGKEVIRARSAGWRPAGLITFRNSLKYRAFTRQRRLTSPLMSAQERPSFQEPCSTFRAGLRELVPRSRLTGGYLSSHRRNVGQPPHASRDGHGCRLSVRYVRGRWRLPDHTAADFIEHFRRQSRSRRAPIRSSPVRSRGLSRIAGVVTSISSLARCCWPAASAGCEVRHLVFAILEHRAAREVHLPALCLASRYDRQLDADGEREARWRNRSRRVA